MHYNKLSPILRMSHIFSRNKLEFFSLKIITLLLWKWIHIIPAPRICCWRKQLCSLALTSAPCVTSIIYFFTWFSHFITRLILLPQCVPPIYHVIFCSPFDLTSIHYFPWPRRSQSQYPHCSFCSHFAHFLLTLWHRKAITFWFPPSYRANMTFFSCPIKS